MHAARASIAIVVPVLDDGAELGTTLARARALGPDELLVVDGGSRDDSVRVAERYADRVLASPRGRAVQLNVGARTARSEVLLFLHADCHLPDGALDRVRAALRDEDVVAGAFEVALRERGLRWRILARAATLRARWTRVPYGDQALFLRRATFEELGGFPELPMLEDVAFARVLKRRGRVLLVAAPVRNSTRRWHREGLVYATVRNWLVTLAFVLGVPPARLVRWYPPVR